MTRLEELVRTIAARPETAGPGDLLALVNETRSQSAADIDNTEHKLKSLIELLNQEEDVRLGFAHFFNQLINGKMQVRLFTELGISSNKGFFPELFRRVNEKVLPQVIDEQELLSVVADVFYQHSDYKWVEGVATETWMQLFDLLGFEANNNHFLADAFYPGLYTSAQIIAARITALGMEPELITRMPHIEHYSSPFLVVSVEVDKLVAEACAADPDWEQMQALYQHLNVMMKQCHAAIAALRKDQKKKGVSIDIVNLLLRIEQNIDRLGRLLGSIMAETKEERLKLAVELFRKIVHNENNKRGLRQHLKANTEMLAFQVVEHTGHTGEHYITNTPKEFYSFLLASMGGGVIISFTTWMKFIIGDLHAAPLAEGLLFGLNYALSFILIYVFHYTLATKQPSMTASALAGALDDKKHASINLIKTAELVVKLCRSQLAAFFGNLVIVIPLTYLMAWAWHHFTGKLIVDEPHALKMIKSVDPVHSLSVVFACVAGVLLFLSGIITGYYDNMVQFSHVGERIRKHRFLSRFLSKSALSKAGDYVEKNYGGLMGNLLLGFMLALTGTLGGLLGIPLDIRHVTLAGGTSAMAYYTLGDYLGWDTVMTAALGIFLVGVMNFVISFGLSLFVALKARKVNFSQSGALLTLIFAWFRARPQDFFYPPKDNSPS